MVGKKGRSFVAPLFVAGPDVGDTQIKEAIDSVPIDGVSRRTSGLSGVGPPPELRMIHVLASLMCRDCRLDHFPAKNSDIEVLDLSWSLTVKK